MFRRLSSPILALSLALGATACGAPIPAARTEQAPQVADELFKSLDANRDGWISAPEGSVLLETADFTRADGNRDGKLNPGELSGFMALGANPKPGQGVHASSLVGIGIGIGIGLGAVTAGYLTYAGLKGAHDVSWPKPNSKTTTPAEIGLVAEDVTFDADIKGLKGWYIPAVNPTTKCIIFQHGHGGNKSQFLAEFVPWMHAKYNVLTFDFRGCGLSPKAPSSLGYFETEEVKAAIGLARSKGNDSIGLMGISMGAASVLNAGADDPTIKGVVEDCSFADFYHAFYPRIVNRKYPLPAPVALAIEKTLELQLRAPVGQAGPLKRIQKWAGRPILFIHGDADKDTTPGNAELLFKAASEPKTLWMVKGADHADSHKVAPVEYEKRVMDFWEKAL